MNSAFTCIYLTRGPTGEGHTGTMARTRHTNTYKKQSVCNTHSQKTVYSYICIHRYAHIHWCCFNTEKRRQYHVDRRETRGWSSFPANLNLSIMRTREKQWKIDTNGQERASCCIERARWSFVLVAVVSSSSSSCCVLVSLSTILVRSASLAANSSRFGSPRHSRFPLSPFVRVNRFSSPFAPPPNHPTRATLHYSTHKPTDGIFVRYPNHRFTLFGFYTLYLPRVKRERSFLFPPALFYNSVSVSFTWIYILTGAFTSSRYQFIPSSHLKKKKEKKKVSGSSHPPRRPADVHYTYDTVSVFLQTFLKHNEFIVSMKKGNG